MARVERMPFTTDEFSSQDKEVAMTWDGSDAPTDFFEQFAVADGPDAQGGEGNGYAQFGPAEVVISPPTSTDLAPPSIASSIHGQDVAQPGSYPRSMAGHPHQQAHYPHHLAVHSDSPHKPPGGYSTSDPELLRLDGLSMRSPGVVAPSATSSTPSSPRPQQPENKKSSRFESMYSTIRKATNLRSRPRLSRQSSSMATTAEPMHAVKPENPYIAGAQLPTSRPLAGPVASLPQGDPSAMSFVNGYLDDPFCMPDLSGLPGQNGMYHGTSGPATGSAAPCPQPTSWLCAGDNFGQDALPQAGGLQWNAGFNPDDAGLGIKQQGGDWWDSVTPREQPCFDAAAYQTENAKNATLNLMMHLESSGVGYEYALANGLIPADAAGGGGSVHMPQPRHPPPEALLNNDFAYDRQQAYLPQAGPEPTRQQQQHHHMHQQHQQQRQQQQQHHMPVLPPTTTPSASGAPTFRRPKQPRAPSSGARYHHAGSLTSPRKVRDRSTSSSSPSPTQSATRSSRATSRGALKQQRRSASIHATAPSLPPPAPPSLTASSTSSLASAASSSSSSSGPATAAGGLPKLAPPHAIRKRKSWSHTRRSSAAMSSTMASAALSTTMSSAGFEPYATPDRRRVSEGGARGASSCGGGGGGNGIGFVNFTPSDHDFLMTGVAPSGSSKTKARREKEAAERQRRLNEAVMTAVAASGGDLTGLRERLTFGV